MERCIIGPFPAREAEIRNGLSNGKQFEKAQQMLGRHLGFEAGKVESDASPDPWWHSGDVTIVFEDHANAGPNAAISATKARQAASHPDWIRAHVPQIAGGIVLPVLVSPATTANKGAMPSLRRVCFWDLNDFRAWSDLALDTVREIRRNFPEPGDLVWKAEAAAKLEEIRADARGLSDWLSARPASRYLTKVK